MADREERRFAEVSRDSVKLMAESTGVDLADDVAALLAEDVCYRLREAAQVRATWLCFILFIPSHYYFGPKCIFEMKRINLLFLRHLWLSVCDPNRRVPSS